MADDMLSLPDLSSPYREALAECAEAALANYDVLAILATGTIVRGTPDPRSDLDVYVLHSGDFRERRQEWHFGVPCEVFVNPPWKVLKYFEEERGERLCGAAHMFATGKPIYDPKNILPELQDLGREILKNPPGPISAQKALETRYHAAATFEDAIDLAERDPDSGNMLLGMAVWELMKCLVWIEAGWWPRMKDLPTRFKEIDPEAYDLALTATMSATLEERLEAGRKLCVRVTGAEGFFEWVSERETIIATCSSPP